MPCDRPNNAVDLAYRQLLQAEWSIGDTAFAGRGGPVWLVSGHRRHGEIPMRAEGRTRSVEGQARPTASPLDVERIIMET
jgi:hypothetical protein